MARWLFSALVLGLAACQGAPAERSDTLVDLATVRTGPRVQADELDGAIRQQPDNTGLLARRAGLRLAAGQPVAALRDVEAALQADDQDGELYYLQARALRALNRLLEGETHLAAHQYEAALASLDRTLRLDPDQPAALFYKGLAYAATADTAQAFDYLQAARARDPRQPEILHQLAFLLNAYRLPDEAAHYAHQGLRLDSTSGSLHYDYGRQLELRGRPDSALHYYRRALALDTTQYRADYRPAPGRTHSAPAAGAAPQPAPARCPRHPGRSAGKPASPARSAAPVPLAGARKPWQSALDV
jgi:tetratricopeptide (TPR) repeat protein